MRASLADAPHWVQAAAALFFVVTLAFLFRPEADRRGNAILAAVAITLLAIVFDWIAFAPGARAFSGAQAHIDGVAVPDDFMGRVAFCLAATLLDVFSLYAWREAWAKRCERKDE